MFQKTANYTIILITFNISSNGSSGISIIIHLLNVDRSQNSTTKKIYMAVTIPITDNDGMLIKFNQNKIYNYKQNTFIDKKNKLRTISKNTSE